MGKVYKYRDLIPSDLHMYVRLKLPDRTNTRKYYIVNVSETDGVYTYAYATHQNKKVTTIAPDQTKVAFIPGEPSAVKPVLCRFR